MFWKPILSLAGLLSMSGNNAGVTIPHMTANYSHEPSMPPVPNFQSEEAWKQREILENARQEFFTGENRPTKTNGFLTEKLKKYKKAIDHNSDQLFVPEVELTYLEPYHRGALMSYVQRYSMSKAISDINKAIEHGEKALDIYDRQDQVQGSYPAENFGFKVEKDSELIQTDEVNITAPIDIGHRFTVLEQLFLASYLKVQKVATSAAKSSFVEDLDRAQKYGKMLQNFVKNDHPEMLEKLNKSPINLEKLEQILGSVEKDIQKHNTTWIQTIQRPDAKSPILAEL